MRAAVLRDRQLVVKDVDDVTPGPGQVLVETLACGICGSDLHFLKRGDMAVGEEQSPFDPKRDLILGHEFSARVIELGAGVDNVAEGDVVVSMPAMVTPEGMAPIGYSHDYPGGYAERMLLMAALCLKVPQGLAPNHAALTEPLAVGRHAVNLSKITKAEGAIVLGTGPIGLAIISALSLDGIEPIVAADFSRTRRELAGALGAHEVVDPDAEAAIDAWGRVGGAQVPVIFEAVGVPGLIDQAMRMAPRSGRIVVAGVCMEPDTITPIVGIRNELTIQFALGYTPEEFSATLESIAAEEVDVAKLITAEVGLDEVPQAFEMLANPDEHVKVMVTPNARPAGAG
ncbi:MAG: zinc-binding dehydrogenase [Chloroflexi bacterium]|nr:zinc-binding dehydrogenase [Chloroflexota bacterium]